MVFSSFDNFIEYFSLSNILSGVDIKSVFLHSSIAKSGSYERLEFLGDAILGYAVADFLYKKFPKKNEGELSKMKSFLVSREVASKIADMIHISPLIKASSAVKKTLDTNINVKSEVFEALICSIYHSYGISKVEQIVEVLVFPFLEFYGDPKTELQELTMAKFKALPEYFVISKDGTEHSPIFTVGVKVSSFVAKGVANKKSLAEREASKGMISILKSKNSYAN